MDTNQLTFKQQKFCNEYLVSFNAYQAALLAGYSENTARKAEILHMPMVQTYLREVMNRATARAEITHELLLNEYRKIAFANMGNYFDFRGDNKRMCELTDDEKAALSYYHVADITENDGFVRGQVCKIKLHNKMAALDRIARHLNFFNVPAKVSATVPEVAEPDMTADDAFEASLEGEVGGLMSEVGSELEENQEDGVESGKLKGESREVEECLTLSPEVGELSPDSDTDESEEPGAGRQVKNVLTLSPLPGQKVVVASEKVGDGDRDVYRFGLVSAG